MWNYRVGTKFFTYADRLVKVLNRKGDRVFLVVSCYYDKNKKPNGWGEPQLLKSSDSLRDLKSEYKLIAGALKKPILDLDSFPKVYKPKKKKRRKNRLVDNSRKICPYCDRSVKKPVIGGSEEEAKILRSHVKKFHRSKFKKDNWKNH